MSYVGAIDGTSDDCILLEALIPFRNTVLWQQDSLPGICKAASSDECVSMVDLGIISIGISWKIASKLAAPALNDKTLRDFVLQPNPSHAIDNDIHQRVSDLRSVTISPHRRKAKHSESPHIPKIPLAITSLLKAMK